VFQQAKCHSKNPCPIKRSTKKIRVTTSEAMHRIAFKMKLHPGQSEEYKRRHTALWPELAELLRETGIRNYSIFLDEETNALFGVLVIQQSTRLNELPSHPVMQRWWAYMADIMETNPDQSPVSLPLQEVFYLK
jgi:L-rhamnose mutarotase